MSSRSASPALTGLLVLLAAALRSAPEVPEAQGMAAHEFLAFQRHDHRAGGGPTH